MAAETKENHEGYLYPRERAALVISLDFELYWGVRHLPWVTKYRENLAGARLVIPQILRLFTEYGIHATWATVGFLFCESTSELKAIAPQCRPDYSNPRLRAYDDLPPVQGRASAKSLVFAPDLIRAIAARPGQEVGTHSFSHYYALEKGAGIASFRADLDAARRAAQSLNIEVTSLVFPKNQVREDYLPGCAEVGITAFRGNPRSWLYRAAPDSEQTPLKRLGRLLDAYLPLTGDNSTDWPRPKDRYPTEITASRYLRPYCPPLKSFEKLRLARIKNGMTKAAERSRIYHLWWHPHDFGRNREKNLYFLEAILSHYRQLRYSHAMESLNMAEVASYSRFSAGCELPSNPEPANAAVRV